MHDLINEGCLKAILISIQDKNLYKAVATECFKKLQDFSGHGNTASDPWTRIWQEWKLQDSTRSHTKARETNEIKKLLAKVLQLQVKTPQSAKSKPTKRIK
jgi:hypothetical protein